MNSVGITSPHAEHFNGDILIARQQKVFNQFLDRPFTRFV